MSQIRFSSVETEKTAMPFTGVPTPVPPGVGNASGNVRREEPVHVLAAGMLAGLRQVLWLLTSEVVVAPLPEAAGAMVAAGTPSSPTKSAGVVAPTGAWNTCTRR